MLRQEDNTDKSTECESVSPDSATLNRRSLIMNRARLSLKATHFNLAKSVSQNCLNSLDSPPLDDGQKQSPNMMTPEMKNKSFSEDFTNKKSSLESQGLQLSKFGSIPKSTLGRRNEESNSNSINSPELQHANQEDKSSFFQEFQGYKGDNESYFGASHPELEKLNEDSTSEDEEPLEALYNPCENINQPVFLRNLGNYDETEELKEELQVNGHPDIHFIQGDFGKYYEEGKILGEGMTGTVKKCYKLPSNEVFAVKVIRYRGDRELLHLMTNEFKNLRKLNHKNIIKVYELFIDYTNNRIYMTMELAECLEMFEVIGDLGHYSESIASEIFKQILSGINYLHLNGVCHRDLKPNNILVSKDGKTVKITDFNVSKFSGKDNKSYTALSKSNYKMWTQTGTEAFSAPEVFDGSQYTEAVDMWSAGVVLYTMLCGYQPFQADSIQELTELILEGKYEFHPESWENISEQAKDLIRHLLTVNYKDRYSPFQALMHPWIANHGKLSNQSISGAIENLWAYLNKNSKKENQEEPETADSNTNQESLEIKNLHKAESSPPTSGLKLSHIRSRSKVLPTKGSVKDLSASDKIVTNKEAKPFSFVGYVSSIEKSYSSSAIEGKYLKKLEDPQDFDAPLVKEGLGMKCFSTVENLPKVFATIEEAGEAYEDNFKEKCLTIKEHSSCGSEDSF